MKTGILIVTMFLMAFNMMSCDSKVENSDFVSEEDLVNQEVLTTNTSEVSTINGTCMANITDTIVTESEKSGLLQMREEEKLAGDVYSYFYDLYNYRVFRNISRSESMHTNAVLYLINAFGLTDPASNESGKFNNQDIQNLYNDLIAMGSTDIVAALKVGAFIEEYDIKDLQDEIAVCANASIIRVYTNLLNGSTRHLKAFTRLLKNKGVDYVPQILSEEQYASYVD